MLRQRGYKWIKKIKFFIIIIIENIKLNLKEKIKKN